LSSWRFGLERAEQVLARGGTLAEALQAGGFVDDARAGRVAIAERSGTLDKTLPLLGTEAREKSQRRFASLVVVIGLVCFGAVAIGIGMAIISGAESYIETIDRATLE
jgi:type II secretory pathway component PulF